MKKLIYLFLLIPTITYSQNTPCTAAAANVNCAGTLGGYSLPAATTWTAVGSGIINPTCPATTGNSNYWITYTIPAGNVSLELNFQRPGSGGGRIDDVGIQVYSAAACTGPFTLLHCFNDAGTNVNQEISVTAGTTYYIRVFDTDGSGGGAAFNYNVCPKTTPGNTPCSAIPITSFPFSYSGNTSTAGYTNSIVGGCEGNYISTGNGNDMVFALTVAANSYYSISLTGTNAAQINAVNIISAPSCSGALTCVSNGAWGGGLVTTSTPYGSTTAGANSPCRTVYFQTAGTYYLVVDGNAGANGPFTLNVTPYTASTAGDNCTNAITLSSGVPVTLNNTNCTYTMGPDDPTPASLYCAGTVENTNWFLFQSDGSGSAVNVSINSVNCNTGYYVNGFPFAGFYSASGQFGIVTGTCGGAFSAVPAVPCASLATGATYSASLPNSSVTNYYLIWDGNGGAECSYTISVTNVNTLPIELLSFNAFLVGKTVKTEWTTQTEINNNYFTIEKSKEGTIWEVVGIVDGAGNSTSVLNYSKVDVNPYKGTSYYRLKQTDYDGHSSYSGMKAIEFSDDSNLSFDIVPNPAGEDGGFSLNFNHISDADYTIVIMDLTGKMVYSKNIQITDTKVEVNELLAKGMYVLQLRNADYSFTKKLIIK